VAFPGRRLDEALPVDGTGRESRLDRRSGRGDEPAPPTPEQLAKLHALIKKQTGEARYLEIDW
jgi:hypothetical protein